ncbi:MAG: hypothetical protein HQL66_10145 [Magnetococcales bacterium]|nr:hypothetical protein [Magnetococcales bacterium]
MKETDRRMQETDRRMQETELQIQETSREIREMRAAADYDLQETRRVLREMSATTEREIKESRLEIERELKESMARTDRELKEARMEIEREMKESSERTKREMKESSERIERFLEESKAENDRVIKEVSRQVGALGSRWGEFVEGLVAPACETLFAERNIPVHQVAPRVKAKSRDGSRRMEIDLLVDNTENVVLVEVKSRLTSGDVRDHLERLRDYKAHYVRSAETRVMGAVAGILIDPGVDRFAINEGLFVIVQSGESVKLANAPDFLPKSW